MAYFVALGLRIVSIAIQVTRETTSPVRLALHLVFLVVVLHGTVPIIFPAVVL